MYKYIFLLSDLTFMYVQPYAIYYHKKYLLYLAYIEIIRM